MHPLRPMTTSGTPRTRRAASRAREAAIAFALANLLVFATTACSENSTDLRLLRGHGPLVSAYDAITACKTAIYRGTGTRLYSNRPYHTAQPVPLVQGMAFCRGERHGTNLWFLDVARPTTLIAFANRGSGLDRRGWTLEAGPVLVAAAGVPFDGIYTRQLEPGRFVIRQGFTRAAPIVFWDPEAAAISAAPPRSSESGR